MIDNLQLCCVRRNEWTDGFCARATIFHTEKSMPEAWLFWNVII